MPRRGIQQTAATGIILGTPGAVSDGQLDLPLVPWEGGSAYWTVAESGDKMTKAEAAGWDDPSFFPIGTWLCPAENVSDLQDVGINVMVGIDGGGGHDPPSTATAAGMSVLPQSETWSPAAIGSDPLCVGWHSTDEPELYMTLAAFETDIIDPLLALDDGRFIHTNHAQVILDTFWWAGQCTDAFAFSDLLSVDHYFYTVQNVRENTTDHMPDTGWPLAGGETTAQNSGGYGFLIDRMKFWGGDAKPYWAYVETQLPFITVANGDVDIILYAQIRGAVWMSIIHEARGVIYFQQNGFYDQANAPTVDPNTGLAPNEALFSLISGDEALKDYVTDLNAQVAALAPVINTQSYVFDFDASGIDTMLKGKDGFAYIFAGVGLAGTTGSKTFTVTGSGITGTNVEVVDESRSVTISGGQFSDSFADEYSIHIYKVAI